MAAEPVVEAGLRQWHNPPAGPVPPKHGRPAGSRRGGKPNAAVSRWLPPFPTLELGKSFGDPAAELGDGLAGDAVAARVTAGVRRGAGLAEQVVPGPVQQLAGDDSVVVALG